jgi:integrase
MRGSTHKRGETWYAMWDEPRRADGCRRQRKKGGFATRKQAQAYLSQTLDSIARQSYVAPDGLTFAEFLTGHWLPGLQVRESTLRSYAGHVRNYLIPQLGHVRLQSLTSAHFKQMYASLAKVGVRKPLAASTITRIHATARGALRVAVADNLIARNPTAGIRLPTAPKPSMQVWSAGQVQTFLAALPGERYAALYHVLAMTGMRRGEVCGLKRVDIDWDEGSLTISRQILDNGYALVEGPPKTRRGFRTISLDDATIQVLRAHHATQAAERLLWGPAYGDRDLMFAKEDGSPVHPDYVTKHFGVLIERTGLPRIRLHDLRHTHATLALAAGIAPKIVSERLGHSGIALTLDTYSHVSPAMDKTAADQVAAAVAFAETSTEVG